MYQRLIVLGLFLGGILSPPPLIATEPTSLQLPTSLTDPQFLSSETWKANNGLEKALQGWPAHSEEQAGERGFADRTIIKQASVSLLGSVWQARYNIYKNDPVAQITLSNSDFPEGTCLALVEWFKQSLGTPANIIDLSGDLDQDNATIDIKADWLFHVTRVQVSCFKLKLYGQFVAGLAAIIYTHKDYLSALEPLTTIQCSIMNSEGVGKFAGLRNSESRPPMTFIIDPNGKRLLRANKSVLGKTEKYSDREIVVSLEGKKGKESVWSRFDRVTGDYLMRSRSKDDPDSGVDLWGMCTKVEGKKF